MSIISQPPVRWYSHPPARAWVGPGAGSSALDFHRQLPGYAPTPLHDVPDLACELGVSRVLIKDESNRLGLPAFKILGASWAACRALACCYDLPVAGLTLTGVRQGLPGRPHLTLVTATDGNHGRALARVAGLLGLKARVYVPRGVSESAVAAIRSEGAVVVELAGSYDDAVRASAASAQDDPDALVVQDTSWPGYQDVPRWIVAGYTTMFAEIDAQIASPGSVDLVVCPVGVGSLAQAAVLHYRGCSRFRPALLTVEPDTAGCVLASLRSGQLTPVETGTTIMAGLNCGTPSGVAWPALLGGVDAAVVVSDEQDRRAVVELAALGLDVGPCGAATLAGLRAALQGPTERSARRGALGLTADSTVVLVSTEGRAANPLPAYLDS